MAKKGVVNINVGGDNSESTRIQVGPKEPPMSIEDRIRQLNTMTDSNDKIDLIAQDVKQKLIDFVNRNGGTVEYTYVDDKGVKRDIDLKTEKQPDGSYKLIVDRENTGMLLNPTNNSERQHEVTTNREIFELGKLYMGYPMPHGMQMGALGVPEGGKLRFASTEPGNRSVVSADDNIAPVNTFTDDNIETPIMNA